MVPFHTIGHPGAGKTTLTADLTRKLTQMGFRVGTIKHSAHVHELDKPGKDSFIHRNAGASAAAMVTKDLAAVYLPRTDEISVDYLLEHHYRHLDISLIEGWISGPYKKIEIWRQATGRRPLFTEIDNTTALITDDPLLKHEDLTASRKGIDRFDFSQTPKLVQWLLLKIDSKAWGSKS